MTDDSPAPPPPTDENNSNNKAQKTPEGATLKTLQDGWIEFNMPNGAERNFGFTKGKIAPTGNLIYIWYSDLPGDTEILEVHPGQWASDYGRAVKEKITLIHLERKKREAKDKGLPEPNYEDLKNDPLFQIEVRQIVQSGKSFLARNLKPLEKILVSGKRVKGGDKPPSNNKFTASGKPTIPGGETEPVFWFNDAPGSHFRRFTKPTNVKAIKDSGVPVGVDGIVISSTEAIQKIKISRWKCRGCEHTLHRHTYKTTEIPSALKECPYCGEKDPWEEKHDFYNAMVVRLQNNTTGIDDEETTSTLPILLRGDKQTRKDPIGLKLKVLGHVEKLRDKQQNYYNVVVSHDAELSQRKFAITDWDIKVIRRFAGLEPLGYLNKDGTCANVYLDHKTVNDRLAKLVAPHLMLEKHQRQASLLAAVGAPEYEDIRGRINELFAGPPSTAKTQLAKWTAKLRRNSRRVDGTKLTGGTATVMILQEPDGSLAIHYGAMPLAKYAILVIDEFEKMEPEERNRLLTAMEDGVVFTGTFGILREIAAPTTVIATLNPRDNRWANRDRIESEEIPIELQQMSRFDILLSFRDDPDLERDRAYVEEKELRERRYEKRKDHAIVALLEKYIEYARQINPTITDEGYDLLNELWVTVRANRNNFILRRNLDGFKRISKAFARLALVDKVDKSIAQETIDFENATLTPFLEQLEIVRSADDELYYQLEQYIRQKAGRPVEVFRAVREIIAKDMRLSKHLLGKDGNRPLLQRKNSAYDKLITAIKANSLVVIIRHEPTLVVRWDVDEDKRRQQKQRKDDKELKKKELQKEQELQQIDGSNGEDSSIKKHQLCGSSETPLHEKNNFLTPYVTVANSSESLHNERGIIERSYETEGVEKNIFLEGGHLDQPHSRYNSLENNSAKLVVVTDRLITPLDMLHQSSISVDLEWSQRHDNKIYQAAFKDHTGKRWSYHITDKEFNKSEPELIRAIIRTLKNYRMVLGYFTQFEGSDWDVLDQRCKRFGIESPVNVYVPPKEDADDEDRKFINLRLKGIHGFDIVDVDLGLMHKKPIVKNFFATNGNIYNSHELEVVSQTRLGRGKFKGVTGKNLASQTVSIQKAYGVDDAELCHDLATCNNSILIAVMEESANIVKMPFDRFCKAGPASWWKSLYRNVMHVTPEQMPNRVTPKKKKSHSDETYRGGAILPYVRGSYENVDVYDYRQLYPNTAILENISPDVICCNCCKNEPTAKVVTGDKELDAKGYWTCEKQEGVFPKALLMLTDLRAKYEQLQQQAKEQGNKESIVEYGIKQQACKLLANAGYGVFGNRFFDFADVRCAELVTACGRRQVNDLRNLIVGKFGAQVLYGDTDSAFIVGIPPERRQEFEATCKLTREKGGLGIQARYEMTYRRLLLISAKNYMGEHAENGKIIVKGLVGKKSNTAPWTRKIFNQVIEHWQQNKVDLMLTAVRDGVRKLEANEVDVSDLEISVTLGQDPVKGYKEPGGDKNPAKVLGTRHKKRQGEAVQYFLADRDKTSEPGVFTEDPNELSFQRYKERLRTAVLKILYTAGFDIESIHDALGLKMPPAGVLERLLHGSKKKKDVAIATPLTETEEAAEELEIEIQ